MKDNPKEYKRRVIAVWDKFANGNSEEMYDMDELSALVESYHDICCRACAKVIHDQ